MNTKSLDLEASSSQYASIADGNQTGLDITGDHSIEAWIKPESLSNAVIVAKAGNSVNSGYSFLIQSDGSLVGRYYDSPSGNTSSANSSTSVITTGEWQHIAMTADVSSGNVKIYLNGVELTPASTTTAATSVYDNSDAFTIGSNPAGGDNYDGKIEHVRVWNGIRTEQEIRQYMFQEPATDEAGLVSWWKFDNDYTDETSNGNDLTASGSPSFSTDVQWTDGGDGKSEIKHCVDDDTVALWHMNGTAGSAAKKDNAEGTAGYDLTEVNTPTAATGFDGEANGAYSLAAASNQYLNAGDNSVFDITTSTDKTLECWVKTGTTGTVRAIMGKWNVSGKNWLLRIESTGIPRFYVGNGSSTTGISISATTDIADDAWHYVAVSYNSSDDKARIYVDGVLEGTSATMSPSDSSAKLGIGADDGDGSTSSSSLWDGEIDEVSISTRVKSAEEIAKYYAGRVSAKYYSGVGDGNVGYEKGTWDTIHDATTGTSVNYTTTIIEAAEARKVSSSDFRIHRAFIPIDTSNLPNSCIIESANLYFALWRNEGNKAHGLVQTTQASNTSLTTADYNQCGDVNNPIEGADRVTPTSINVYYNFNLNTIGKSWINTSGYTKLGMRLAEDLDDIEPTNDIRNGIYCSEGTYKPYLWIEYTVLPNVEITPDVISVESTVQTPTIQNHTEVTPDSITVESTIYAPTIDTGGEVSPDVISVETTVHAPTIFNDIEITPDPITINTTIYTPTQMGGLWNKRTKPTTTWTPRGFE